MKTLYRFASLVLILVVVSMFAGCASTQSTASHQPVVAAGTEQSATAVIPTVNKTPADNISVAGEWKGRLSWSTGSGPITLYLKQEQEGNKVEGSYDVAIRHNVPVVGTLNGNQLSLTMPSIAYSYINVTIREESGRLMMEGNYRGVTQRLSKLVAKKLSE